MNLGKQVFCLISVIAGGLQLGKQQMFGDLYFVAEHSGCRAEQFGISPKIRFWSARTQCLLEGL